jgi:hypothetical protein
MTALATASQNSTTSRRRSVHQRSLPSWLPQAWVRSITQRRPAWIGAATPRHRDTRDASLATRFAVAQVDLALLAAQRGQPDEAALRGTAALDSGRVVASTVLAMATNGGRFLR